LALLVGVLPSHRHRWHRVGYCLRLLLQGTHQGPGVPLPETKLETLVTPNVDWDFARTVAVKVAGREPFAESYHQPSLESDMVELTAQAERLVEAETGLVSLDGPARARVTGREGWIDANIAGFERLARPLLDHLASDSSSQPDEAADGEDPSTRGGVLGVARSKMASVIEPAGAKLAGAQLGAVLGWMSSKVLGQYDLLIIEDERPEDQDWVYYVAPNVLALEKRYGFPPREFRLWLAVHECTHRAQFTGVRWLRPYFWSLVNELLETADPDPKRVMDVIGELVRKPEGEQRSALGDGGLAGLLATPEQKKTIDKLTGLMSLLEGHGDIIMTRATGDLVPSSKRFARVMSQRRTNATGLSRIVRKLTGIDAKLAQYEQGERFVRAVEAHGGSELFDQVWSGAENLPTINEIRSPDLWISRLGAPTGA